jgi:hypothetical protein
MRFSILKGDLMGEKKIKKKKKDECTVPATDFKGDPNLCCCYIVGADGKYVDPCYRPVADCC